MFDVFGDNRQRQGLEIAATAKIVKKGGAWRSQAKAAKGATPFG